MLTKKGDIASNQPDYFLTAASLWHKQGRRISPEGFCVWREEPKEILQHIAGKHYKVTGFEEQPDQC